MVFLSSKSNRPMMDMPGGKVVDLAQAARKHSFLQRHQRFVYLTRLSVKLDALHRPGEYDRCDKDRLAEQHDHRAPTQLHEIGKVGLDACRPDSGHQQPA